MAEGLTRFLLEVEDKDDVKVMSAGTSAVVGFGPTIETIEVMQDMGVDVSAHLGQAVTDTLIEHSDAIFCMEKIHQELLVDMAPEAKEKIHLFKVFGNESAADDPNIPDPIGQPKEVYKACAQAIKEGVERIVRSLDEEQR